MPLCDAATQHGDSSKEGRGGQRLPPELSRHSYGPGGSLLGAGKQSRKGLCVNSSSVDVCNLCTSAASAARPRGAWGQWLDVPCALADSLGQWLSFGLEMVLKGLIVSVGSDADLSSCV